jgi:hypothetical protein
MDEVVSMSSPREVLLLDIRKSLGRAIAATSNLDLIDQAFAAWLLGFDALPTDVSSLVAASIEQRLQSYRSVAALGFTAKLLGATCTFRTNLCEALQWLSKRPMSMCGAMAGFVSDPVALLGIGLGAGFSGDPTIKDAVAQWMGNVITARESLPAFAAWENCLVAAAVFCVGRHDLVRVPDAASLSDCRIILSAMGVLPHIYPADVQRDEANLIKLLFDEPAISLGFTRMVIRAAAYDALKRTTINSGRVTTEHLCSSESPDESSQLRPKALVSYAWEEDGAHQYRVVKFTNALREYGIDATVDVFRQSPPEGWPAWMLKEIRQSQFVLMVITETYRRRFEGEEKPGKGKGVKWEASIVTREVYDAESNQDKFLPVLFGKEHIASMPTIFKGNTYWDVSDPERLKELVMHMTDQPLYVPAPLGRVPNLPPRNIGGQH